MKLHEHPLWPVVARATYIDYGTGGRRMRAFELRDTLLTAEEAEQLLEIRCNCARCDIEFNPIVARKHSGDRILRPRHLRIRFTCPKRPGYSCGNGKAASLAADEFERALERWRVENVDAA